MRNPGRLFRAFPAANGTKISDTLPRVLRTAGAAQENEKKELQPEDGSRAGRWLVWSGLLLIAVSRLPYVLCGFELNTDESAQMAVAKRMAFDWVPWRSTDYLTSGPLMAGFLALLQGLGIPITYASVHVIAFALLLSILLLSWRLSAGLFGSFPASVAFFSATAWLSGDLAFEFAHYASELLPSFLLAAGLCLLVRDGECTTSPWRFAAGSFVIGLVPWAKLQAAPIALAACLWIALALRSSLWSRRTAAIRILIAAFAAMLPTSIMLLICEHAGTLEYFWKSFVLNGLAYSGATSGQTLYLHFRAASQSPLVEGLLVVLIAAGVQYYPFSQPKGFPRRLLLPLLLLAAALYAAFKPEYDFPHYQILLICPVLLMVAFLFREIHLSVENLGRELRRRVFAALAAMIAGAPLMASPAGYASSWYLTATRSPRISYDEQKLSAPLASLMPRKASLFVWGWAPSLYVDLDARPATRYSIHQFLVQPSPYRSTMREFLLKDLERERPEWIVVVEKTENFELGSTPPFAELQSVIDASYGLVFQNADLRAYRRNSPAFRAN